MAKELTAAQVAEFMRANGMDVPKELNERIENEKSDAAFHYLNETVLAVMLDKNDKEVTPKVRTDRVTAWQERLFTLAENMSAEFKSETRNQRGRGTGTETVARATVETEFGTLKVELVS